MYTVALSRSARKELEKLTPVVAERVAFAIHSTSRKAITEWQAPHAETNGIARSELAERSSR